MNLLIGIAFCAASMTCECSIEQLPVDAPCDDMAEYETYLADGHELFFCTTLEN